MQSSSLQHINFILGTGMVPADITNEGHEIQYFNLNVAQLRDLRWPNVVSAKMFLHLPAATSPKDLKVWIDIRQVVLPQPSDVPTFKQKRIVAATLLPDKAGWVEIHLKDITQEWFKDPSKNMGLEIIVNTENNPEKRIPVGIQHQEGERNVRLIIFFFTIFDPYPPRLGNFLLLSVGKFDLFLTPSHS